MHGRTTRGAWLLQGTLPHDAILEIGPSYSPIAPKTAGWRTHVVDHAPAPELRAKYAALGVDTAAIEPVDSVWAGGALHDALPPEAVGTFARLIASHVIEHIPDMVGFFTSAARLLASDGVMALAVPDQRHCFDFFRPLSATGDVLEAHAQRRMRHSRRNLWDQAAYAVAWHGLGAWGANAVPDLAFTSSLAAAPLPPADFGDHGDALYTDCHAWQVTPARFQLILLELGQLQMIDWHVETLEPMGAEFLCLLRRGVPSLSPEAVDRQRMELLYRGLAETRAQIDRALGNRNAAGFPDTRARWGAVGMLRRAG